MNLLSSHCRLRKPEATTEFSEATPEFSEATTEFSGATTEFSTNRATAKRYNRRPSFGAGTKDRQFDDFGSSLDRGNKKP